MGWIDAPERTCEHPDRPEIKSYYLGSVWQCDGCGQRWKVKRVDYGHDVMPGESPVGYTWHPTDKGR